MSGAEIAAEVHEALLEAAEATGSGEYLATFTRPGAVDRSMTPPTMGAPVLFTARVVETNYADKDVDGTNVQSGDVMLLVSAAGGNEPQGKDKVTIGGRTLSVVQVMRVAPGGDALMFKVQARGV